MAFVSDWLIPFLAMTLGIGVVGWVLFLIYYYFKKIFPTLNLWFKYKVLKKPFNEQMVENCLDAYDKDYSDEELQKELLILNIKPNTIKEYMFIYDKIKKIKMKGGLEYE